MKITWQTRASYGRYYRPIFFIWIQVDYALRKFVEILALPLESTGGLPKLTPPPFENSWIRQVELDTNSCVESTHSRCSVYEMSRCQSDECQSCYCSELTRYLQLRCGRRERIRKPQRDHRDLQRRCLY